MSRKVFNITLSVHFADQNSSSSKRVWLVSPGSIFQNVEKSRQNNAYCAFFLKRTTKMSKYGIWCIFSK